MVYGILSPLSIPFSMRAEYPSSNVSLSEKTSSCKRDFVFIVNPKGANGRTEREWVKLLPYLHTRLGSQCNICVSFTSWPTHATDITRKAIREGADAVIAVGGDGTIHEVVNGFFGLGENVPVQDVQSSHTTTLGFIPLGTGSDFIRTLGWKNNPKEAIDHIAKGLKSQVDVGVISGDKYGPHYFINVADIHLSAKAGYHAGKFKTFGNLCYVFGSLRAFMGHHDRDLRIKINGGDWMICKSITTLCIANAKYFGGGMNIAPNAYPWSGDLEVVIFQNFKWYDFLLKLHKLYRGTHLSEKNVSSICVHTIEVEEIEPFGNIYVQSDGEHLGFLPSKISILPSAIEMFI